MRPTPLALVALEDCYECTHSLLEERLNEYWRADSLWRKSVAHWLVWSRVACLARTATQNWLGILSMAVGLCVQLLIFLALPDLKKRAPINLSFSRGIYLFQVVGSWCSRRLTADSNNQGMKVTKARTARKIFDLVLIANLDSTTSLLFTRLKVGSCLHSYS